MRARVCAYVCAGTTIAMSASTSNPTEALGDSAMSVSGDTSGPQTLSLSVTGLVAIIGGAVGGVVIIAVIIVAVVVVTKIVKSSAPIETNNEANTSAAFLTVCGTTSDVDRGG